MPANSFDDAYYAQALFSIKEQLSNWVLRHESIIQSNIAHLPVEAFSDLDLAFSEVKSSQVAEIYKKSSLCRTALLQQFIANKLCHYVLSGTVGPANLRANFNGLGKFLTGEYDFEGLRKKVLHPCIELASKMLQEQRILIPMMLPAGTNFDTQYCTTLDNKSTSGPILFCEFPMLAAKQGPKSYIVFKAPVHLCSEWSFASSLVFAGALPSAGILTGLDAIVYNPQPVSKPLPMQADAPNEKGHPHSVVNSDVTSAQSAYDVHHANRRASSFKKIAFALGLLSILLLAGLATSAALAGQYHSQEIAYEKKYNALNGASKTGSAKQSNMPSAAAAAAAANASTTSSTDSAKQLNVPTAAAATNASTTSSADSSPKGGSPEF